jgi:hypothetical protein
MPDLTGLTALDVAIGLAFLYFALSTVCSAIQELIAGMFGWRAKHLEKGIRQLLTDPTPFWEHARITALGEPIAKQGRKPVMTRGDQLLAKPSYIPARTFAQTVLDTLVPPAVVGTDSSADAIAAARTAAASLPDGIRDAVTDALDEGRRDIDAVREKLEQRFDAVMDRASGWYKRNAQKWLLGIAFAVAVAGNVDSFQIANRLWKDDTLRAAVVERANARAQIAAEDDEEGVKPGTVSAVADSVDDVSELKLPLGWTHGNVPHGSPETIAWGILGKILGILATTFALLLGAPFWFDVLGKFAKLRATGNRIGTIKDNDRAAEDRDDPSGRRPSPAPADAG